MGVKWDGRGSEYNFGQPLSIGRDVPLLSIRAHGSSGEGSAAQAVADASPDFPGDAAGEKALSWCAFLGFWSYGLEEGAFSVRCRPGCGLSPLRARAGAALVFFWADAQ